MIFSSDPLVNMFKRLGLLYTYIIFYFPRKLRIEIFYSLVFLGYDSENHHFVHLVVVELHP